MPCETCGHDMEHCPYCVRVVGQGDRESEEHKKHVKNCPGAGDKPKPD
jgi:hypothetical protein